MCGAVESAGQRLIFRYTAGILSLEEVIDMKKQSLNATFTLKVTQEMKKELDKLGADMQRSALEEMLNDKIRDKLMRRLDRMNRGMKPLGGRPVGEILRRMRDGG
ncbi:MAG: hypothetical protein A3G34_15155 [Candidatus Lindowbacteria bacterium RIFCSPLOWO2_12_FULL_62_27]|nr:MAG: hypothetical protein A3G34_15155 [Candidatus Lindowbacteria bacterium RIFCSPLOWO2_12_FULL_62_27]OGH63863.1 MAG: hypothetical protein A3I06_06135 [Candidatus Lindowbacteria bacterium RIFCSPLOWO2_02_FULL_62_12]